MTVTHFTAWLVTDTSALDQPCMDVTVIEDQAISYKQDEEGNETPVWASQGDQKFYAVTTVDAHDGDAEDGIGEAESLMLAAGWKTVGEWEAVDNAYIVTVEYDGDYRHTIETTDNAEDPAWYELIRGDAADEHDGTPEEYGREVLSNFWADNSEQPPQLADEYGNAYYRSVVRTQNDDATLAVVESSAAAMTPAAFKVSREFMGLSDGWLANHLGVSSRTIRHWEQGKYLVPEGVEKAVIELKRRTQKAVSDLVEQLKGDPHPMATTYRNDDDYQAAQPDSEFPASWHRAVVARVAQEVTGLGIRFSGTEAEDA